MLYAKCNYDNPADALFCMKCGTKVENRCSPVKPCWLTLLRPCGSRASVFCDLQNAGSSPRRRILAML